VVKTLQKFTLPCVNFVVSRQWTEIQFVVSRQWTVVQFSVWLLVFVKDVHHKPWHKARKAENINRLTKCETFNRLSCRRSSDDVRGNITRYQDFTNISIPYFDKRFAEKKLPGRSLTSWLLNRNTIAWKLQHYWNEDLTLNFKHSCIELSLLTKRELQTLNRSWNRSQTSGEVQTTRDPKNFD
jgi:hypothetical protein